MSKESREEKLSESRIRHVLDQTLVQHIEELIGSSYGIGALPINTITVPCLVLLAERESEIENSPSDPPERYTRETFLKALADVGLEADEETEAVIKKMIEKGYMEVDPGGMLSAKRPTTSMVQLLDRLYPGMPGMNLVAYIMQTVDEVMSDRRDLATAASHLDETLRMQGVRICREKSQPRGDGVGEQDQQSPGVQRLEVSEIFRDRSPEAEAKTARALPSDARVLSADEASSRFRVRELFSSQTNHSHGNTTEPGVESLSEPSEPFEGEEVLEDDDIVTHHDLNEPKPPSEEASWTPSDMPQGSGRQVPQPLTNESFNTDLPQDTGPRTQGGLSDTGQGAGDRVGAIPPSRDSGQGVSIPCEPEAEVEGAMAFEQTPQAVTTDDLVAQRIASFEETLAMACPLCRTGRVQSQQTVKGKSFHVCSNKNCVFVSWGKPYHIPCPRCANPFLVESNDRAGETILRCPRATCHYRQPLFGEGGGAALPDGISTAQQSPGSSLERPKPRRMVVRRRRVKRRRKN